MSDEQLREIAERAEKRCGFSYQEVNFLLDEIDRLRKGEFERCRICGFDSALVSGDCYFPVEADNAG